MKPCGNEKRMKKTNESAPPKGKVIPDSKPENDYKKVGKKAEKARKADKR